MTAAKFYTALTGALAVAVTVTADGTIDLNDWVAIIAAGVGALAVYYIPNKPLED